MVGFMWNSLADSITCQGQCKKWRHMLSCLPKNPGVINGTEGTKSPFQWKKRICIAVCLDCEPLMQDYDAGYLERKISGDNQSWRWDSKCYPTNPGADHAQQQGGGTGAKIKTRNNDNNLTDTELGTDWTSVIFHCTQNNTAHKLTVHKLHFTTVYQGWSYTRK